MLVHANGSSWRATLVIGKPLASDCYRLLIRLTRLLTIALAYVFCSQCRYRLTHWPCRALFLALDNIHGFRRRFSLQDESIQYPYVHSLISYFNYLDTYRFTVKERVPNWLLGVISLGVPAVVMPIVNLFTVRMIWDLHNALLGLVLSLAISGSTTQIFKITAGRPRPDLIARCSPMQGAQDSPVFGLVDDSICTQTSKAILIDGWRSFSSGHSCRA